MKPATLDKVSSFLGELLGTAILVFLGCMGCVSTETFHNNHLQMCFNFGLVILVAVQCFACVSGSHLNPSVTIVAYIYNMITLPMSFVYFAGQMLGAFIGYGLLKIVLPESTLNVGRGLCVTMPHSEITVWQGLGIEFIITLILAWICCGVWDPRNSKFHDSVPIRFGLAIVCLACTAGPFTGGSMNPARSFAPALWNNQYEHHWIYWIGPLAGATVGGLSYKSVFRREVVEATPNDKLRTLEEVPLS